MKMLQGRKLSCAGLLMLGVVIAAPQAMIAQDHVVSPGQIRHDVTSSSAVRQQNEQQLRSFLSTKEIQNAMKSEGVR